jgi:hypothetical protein
MRTPRLVLFAATFSLILMVLLAADAVVLSATVFVCVCVHGSVLPRLIPCTVLVIVLGNVFVLAMQGWQRRLYSAAIAWCTRRRRARRSKQQAEALVPRSQGLRPKMRTTPQPSRWYAPPEADDEP